MTDETAPTPQTDPARPASAPPQGVHPVIADGHGGFIDLGNPSLLRITPAMAGARTLCWYGAQSIEILVPFAQAALAFASRYGA
jgi:hypothetical protein